jgi:hypothetical protein
VLGDIAFVMAQPISRLGFLVKQATRIMDLKTKCGGLL